MKKVFLFCILITSAVFYLNNNAQALNNKTGTFINETSNNTLPKNIPLENSLLWEVSGNGLKKPSYILGVMHPICEEDFIWYQEFENAVLASDKIILEVDAKWIITYLEKQFDPEILKKYWKGSVDDSVFNDIKKQLNYNSGTLKDKVPFKRISDFKRRGGSLNKFKSRVINSALISYWLDTKDDESKPKCQVKLSYEVKLVEKGLVYGKKFDYLETIEEQLELYNLNLNKSSGSSGNNKTIKNEPSLSNNKTDLTTLYLQENISELYNYIVTKDIENIDIDVMLFDRNVNWVKRLSSKLEVNTSSFIAVGAGHLAGELGLINLLREKGYTIKPILNRTKKI